MDPAVSLPEEWTPPLELIGALPRKRHFTKRGKFSVVLALALLPAAIFISVVLRIAAAEAGGFNEQLRAEGREATAQIVRLWHTPGKGSVDMVTYVFSAGKARVQGECEVPGRYWDGLRKGDNLAVRYLPPDPAVNHPAAWEEDTVPLWVRIVFPLSPAAIGVVLLVFVRRQGEVAAQGLPAAGVVEQCVSVRTGWTIRYRFRTRDGAVMSGRDQASRPLERGSEVCVLYLPNQPQRNSIYPLSFYRMT